MKWKTYQLVTVKTTFQLGRREWVPRERHIFCDCCKSFRYFTQLVPFSFLVFLSLLEVGWTSLELHDVMLLWTNQNPIQQHLNEKVATFVRVLVI